MRAPSSARQCPSEPVPLLDCSTSVSPGGRTGLSSALHITGAHSPSTSLRVRPSLSLLCLSACLCARRDRGAFSPRGRQTNTIDEDLGWIIISLPKKEKKQNRKFYSCAKWNSDKWSAQVDRRRTRDTSCISFFLKLYLCFYGESGFQDELAVEQPGALHPESRAQAAGLGRSTAGQMRTAVRRGWGRSGTPQRVTRLSGQPRGQNSPLDPPGAIQNRTLSASTSGGPGRHVQRHEHRYW